MHRVLEYGLLFLVLAVLQVFFFNGLNLSVYVTPLVYVVFLGMLPANINPGLLLVLGFAAGAAMDFFTGLPGVNTIASLFTAFIRPGVLRLTVGKEAAGDAGAVTARNYGMRACAAYYGVIVFIHCLVFFLFEALAWHNIFYTLLRVVVSGSVTLLFVIVLANIYPLERGARRG